MSLSKEDYHFNFIVNTLDGVFFNLGMTLGSIYTFFPLFLKNLGAGNFEISLIPAITNLGWAIPGILGAKYAEKYAKKINMLLKFTWGSRVPYIILSLVVFFLAPYNPKLTIYIALLLLGIITFSMGFLGPCWMSMVEKVILYKRRGIFFALGSGIGTLMGIGGAELARYFLNRYPFPMNFGYIFLIAGIVSTFSVSFLSLTREEPDSIRKEEVSFYTYIKGMKEVLLNKNFRNYLITRILGSITPPFATFIVVFALKKFLIQETIVAEYTAVLAVSQGLSSFLFGVLGDKYGHKLIISLGKISSITGLLLLLFGNSPTFIYLVYILLGMANSSASVGDQTLSLDLVPKDKKELFLGSLNLIVSPFAFISPLIAGKIVDFWGFEMLFSISLILSLITLCFLLRTVSDPRRKISQNA
ncbi:MAG TPA: MFS transporter [Dictyoglomaceae bacterium]|nr:MFS transporter [Dictyoglomaceae bacterium]HOP95357.1 MFS transporter [Dictyoglomaceae bacterium]HPP16677.1 MFS transporter [Dictyoglomaceae bacterium]HPU43796.1 MFS transporter [Dictyoglomaceae bacterium]